MKKIFFSIVIILISIQISTFAQSKVGIISYKQQIGNTFNNANLYFSEQYSYYIYNKEGIDSLVIENSNNSLGINLPVTPPDKIGEICFINFKQNTLKAREIVLNIPYIYEEPIPIIKWELRNEIKKIGNFECQMATASFRGRFYTAWFTSAIPISAGPWKLQGLPGLILEVYDNTNNIKFNFSGIAIKTKDDIVSFDEIFPEKKGKKISFEEHKTILKLNVEKFQKLLMSDAEPGIEIEINVDLNNVLETDYEKI